jgi:hypothetical protein
VVIQGPEGFFDLGRIQNTAETGKAEKLNAGPRIPAPLLNLNLKVSPS